MGEPPMGMAPNDMTQMGMAPNAQPPMTSMPPGKPPMGQASGYVPTWQLPSAMPPTMPPVEGLTNPINAKVMGDTWTITPAQTPYATSQINEVDDYEYNMVFDNESERGVTKATRDLLMSQYPMDWSTKPPSSGQFEKGIADYNNQRIISGTTDTAAINSQYAAINPGDFGGDPVNREILMTYTPKNPQSLTTYDAADAKEIINKIYSAKGVIPEVRQTANNVFTIVSTTPADANGNPIEEDQAPAGPVSRDAGENTIVVPTITVGENKGLDPFFTPGEVTRDRKWDYTRWTPGLERMFAPNEPMNNWY